MNIVIHKYGGTSVGSLERIKRVAERIVEVQEKGHDVVAVISAMGQTTDELLAMASQIHERPSGRELDLLLATGEQVSVALLAMAIQRLGHHAVAMTGFQSGIETDGNHSCARIQRIDTRKILHHLRRGAAVIVAGFQGMTNDGEITTLGRGGSDITAVALAAVLSAVECDIFTDVEGIYTADPALVPEARLLKYISYDEMLELASAGAKVLHKRSVEIIRKYGVIMRVRSSFTTNGGTAILASDQLEEVVVTGVALDDKVAKVRVAGLHDTDGSIASLFEALSETNINVKLVIQALGSDGRINVTFILERDDSDKAVAVLEPLRDRLRFESAEQNPNVATVSIVGSGIASTPETAARMFRALAGKGICIHGVSTSEIRIVSIVDVSRARDAVQALHQEFQLEKLERRRRARLVRTEDISNFGGHRSRRDERDSVGKESTHSIKN